MTNRICKACDKNISHRGAKAIYCDNACRRWVANGNTAKRIRSVDACVVCSGSLECKMITAVFCSRKCKNHAVQKRRVRDDADDI